MPIPTKRVEPQIFTYDAGRLRRELRQLALFGTVAALGFLYPVAHNFPRLFQDVGWPMALAAFGLWLALPLGYCVIACALAIPFREGLRRLDHRITADADGITFEDASHRIRSAWPDVVRTGRAGIGRLGVPWRFVVETRAGTFDFLKSIDNGIALRKIIDERASNAGAISDESERLAPENPAEVSAAHVHTYRTRTNRALLWFPAAFAIGIPLSLWLGRLDDRRIDDPAFALTMAALLAAFTLWCWWRYRTVSVRTDALGITWQDSRRRIFIPWTDVRSYRETKADMATFSTITGAKACIRLWFGLSDIRALDAEIRRNSPALQHPAPSTQHPAPKE